MLLTKRILPAGPYMVNTAKGGKVMKDFTKDFLSKVVQNTNGLIDAGYRIPAPFQHSAEAVPTDKLETDASKNGGYWQRVWLSEGEDGNPCLEGIVDAPGDADDYETPAGKFTHTIKEVSACIKDKFVDGIGREWGPCMLHCAGVVHPVVPSQEEFSIPEEAMALSMGDMMNIEGASKIPELVEELKKASIIIPAGISLEALPDVLLVALRQLNAGKDTGDEEAYVESRAVYLSQGEGDMPITEDVAKAMVSKGAINPKTNKPFTVGELTEDNTADQNTGNQSDQGSAQSKAQKVSNIQESDDEGQLQNVTRYARALTNQYINDKKSTLQGKVDSLIQSGRVSKEFADERLYPKISNYEFDINDSGEIAKAPIEDLVESFEYMPAPETSNQNAGEPVYLSNGLPLGSSKVKGDSKQNQEPSKELLDEVKKDLLRNM